MLKSLIVIVIFIIGVTAKDKDPNTDCNPSNPAPVLNHTKGELDLDKSIDQLAGKTCEWVIDGSLSDQKVLNIHLDFVENLVLADKDSLVITTDDNKTTLFTANGFQWSGVVLLGAANKKIRVKLILTNEKFDRNFDVRYGINDSSVQIQNIESTGKFVFPHNRDIDLPTIDFTIVLKTKINSQNLLLNLEALDLSGGVVSFDKVDKYANQTFDGKTTPDFLLTTDQQINIKLTKLVKLKSDAKGLQLHYELVDSVCSQYKNFSDLDDYKKTIDVKLPNNGSLQSLSNFRCLNIFEHLTQSAKLLLDLRNFQFKNTGDLITVLDGNTRDSNTLAVIESQFLDNYWKDLYIYSSSNKMWIMYSSPQVVNREPDTSGIGVLGLSQGGTFLFNTSVSNTTIATKAKGPVPVVFTFTTDVDKQVFIDLNEKSPLPGNKGQPLLEIFESDGRSSQPFIVLNGGELPPDILASNTNQLKVVFNQSVDFPNIPVRTVPKGCHSTYLGTSGASFGLSGNCSALCSWLIPKKDDSNGTFLLQFSHLNLAKNDELIIEMLGPNPSRVLGLKGNLSIPTFPDLILDANQTYIMYIRRECDKQSGDGSQLVGVSLIFVNQDLTTHEMTYRKDNSYELRTENYPNYYSVGSDHRWEIGFENETKALFTILDIDLSPGHQLLYTNEELILSVNTTDLSSLSDIFVPNKLFLNLSSHSIDSKKQPLSGRGFNSSLTTFNCGDNIIVEWNKEITVSTPNNLTGISKCIWMVSTKDPNATAVSVFDFSVNDGKDEDLLKRLRVWDSNSMRANKFLNFSYFNTSRKSSSTNTLIIEYTIDDKKPMALNLTFKQTICKMQCIYTKRCLLPEFFCNKINDCGDFSDERCNGTKPVPPDPTPPPTPIIYNSGVNGWVVFLVICPLCIGIGVLGVLFGPQLLSRVGRGRYREFQDFSEVS